MRVLAAARARAHRLRKLAGIDTNTQPSVRCSSRLSYLAHVPTLTQLSVWSPPHRASGCAGWLYMAPPRSTAADACAASRAQDGLSVEELKQLPLDMPPPPKDVPGMAEQFMRDGFLHVPNALTPEERDHCLRSWTGPQEPFQVHGDGSPTDESVSIHIKNTWNTEHRAGAGKSLHKRCST